MNRARMKLAELLGSRPPGTARSQANQEKTMPRNGQSTTQIALDRAAVASRDGEGGHSRATGQVAGRATARQEHSGPATQRVPSGAQILSNSCRDPE
jgi:hypothetical protein